MKVVLSAAPKQLHVSQRKTLLRYDSFKTAGCCRPLLSFVPARAASEFEETPPQLQSWEVEVEEPKPDWESPLGQVKDTFRYSTWKEKVSLGLQVIGVAAVIGSTFYVARVTRTVLQKDKPHPPLTTLQPESTPQSEGTIESVQEHQDVHVETNNDAQEEPEVPKEEEQEAKHDERSESQADEGTASEQFVDRDHDKVVEINGEVEEVNDQAEEITSKPESDPTWEKLPLRIPESLTESEARVDKLRRRQLRRSELYDKLERKYEERQQKETLSDRVTGATLEALKQRAEFALISATKAANAAQKAAESLSFAADAAAEASLAATKAATASNVCQRGLEGRSLDEVERAYKIALDARKEADQYAQQAAVASAKAVMHELEAKREGKRADIAADMSRPHGFVETIHHFSKQGRRNIERAGRTVIDTTNNTLIIIGKTTKNALDRVQGAWNSFTKRSIPSTAVVEEEAPPEVIKKGRTVKKK